MIFRIPESMSEIDEESRKARLERNRILAKKYREKKKVVLEFAHSLIQKQADSIPAQVLSVLKHKRASRSELEKWKTAMLIHPRHQMMIDSLRMERDMLQKQNAVLKKSNDEFLNQAPKDRLDELEHIVSSLYFRLAEMQSDVQTGQNAQAMLEEERRLNQDMQNRCAKLEQEVALLQFERGLERPQIGWQDEDMKLISSDAEPVSNEES